MKIKTLFPLLALLVPVLKAETLVVLSGNSIQEKIDVASDGDIIAIFGGTYSQDVIINKRIRLVELAGQDVHITGNVTFDSVENCPPFEGFKVGSLNKGLIVDGAGPTTGLVIKDTNTDTGGRGVVIEGDSHEVSIVGGIHSGVVQKGGTLVVNSASITGNFETNGSVVKTIAFRVNVSGGCSWGGMLAKSWFGYGQAKNFVFNGEGCRSTLIGSTIDRGGVEANSIAIYGKRNQTVIINNLVVGLAQEYSRDNDSVANIYSQEIDGIAFIQNNYLEATQSWRDQTKAIRITNSNKYVITNNVWKLTAGRFGGSDVGRLVSGPFGTTVTNNYIKTNTSGVFATDSGATGQDNIIESGDTKLFSEDNIRVLASESPLIDMGISDPRFNDLDGSRNDIGPSGGSWYDPEGWTTENPVVISFDLSPDQVLGGVNDEVEISEIQAISAP
ncbi:hypothetical protein N8629_01340 [Akkermansiaceae bacterium]|nr:hypothetical protein [Akkermansiaceae bacterium]MDB4706474.1 hypothetical protein [Akkermansiaceae bacterium]